MLKGMQFVGFGGTAFDLVPPSITSGNSTTVAENAVLSFNVTTDDPSKIIIGGADAAHFEFAVPNALSMSHTLRWLSNGTKDFEAPADADANNVYSITLTPRDAAGNNGTPQSFSATVTDDYDWASSFSATLVTNTTLTSGVTIRQLVSAAQLSVSGNNVRLLLRAGALGNSVDIDAIYIGEKAAAGDAYDMKASSPAPTQFLFGGNTNVSIPSNQTQYTDPLAFPIDHTKDYIVGVHFSNSATVRDGTLSGAANYIKLAVNEAGTADVSGYSTNSNLQRLIQAVEVAP